MAKVVIDEIESFLLSARASAEPLFRSKADNVRHLYNAALFSNNLSSPLLNGEWLEVFHNNKPVQTEVLWKKVQEKNLLFLDRAALNAFLGQGAALVLEGLDILNPEVNQLCLRIEDNINNCLCNAVAFFSQSKNEAYRPHIDADDVIVIHIGGGKRWYTYDAEPRRYLNKTNLDVDRLGKPSIFDLSEGDLLYIRAGVPHHCETLTSKSLHMSIDLVDISPSIERITSLLNIRYNGSMPPSHSSLAQVISHYRNLLENREFIREMQHDQEAAQHNARAFRKKIAESQQVRSFDVIDNEAF